MLTLNKNKKEKTKLTEFSFLTNRSSSVLQAPVSKCCLTTDFFFQM